MFLVSGEWRTDCTRRQGIPLCKSRLALSEGIFFFLSSEVSVGYTSNAGPGGASERSCLKSISFFFFFF